VLHGQLQVKRVARKFRDKALGFRLWALGGLGLGGFGFFPKPKAQSPKAYFSVSFFTYAPRRSFSYETTLRKRLSER
jgi:hypothetical protein